MTRLILRLYDYMRSRAMLRWVSLVLLTVGLAVLTVRQTYKEDIADFLPLNSKYHSAMQVYQQTSGSDRIFAIFQYRDSTLTDPDTLVAAVDRFAEVFTSTNAPNLSSCNVQTSFDLEQAEGVAQFVYDNMPYFLTERDYERFDSLLQEPDYVSRQIAEDKQLLLFPMSSLLSANMGRDPLNLFTPIVSSLNVQRSTFNVELYDGHIFSPDLSRAIAMLRSPFGASETENNAQLKQMLEQAGDSVRTEYPEVDVRLTGGPIIAVGNAQQIKSDSLLSVAIAVVLIVVLLLVVFRRVWPIVLIVMSIAWGWLFAMGWLAVIHDSVSVIVVGISSVILGIAVNYPLHLIAHLQHTPNIRSALKEIVMPLVVGNITTVGAFMALVPLKSAALRDLGLFSAFLLIGTILFVLLYLPHLFKSEELRVKSEEFAAAIPSSEPAGTPKDSSLLTLHSSLIPLYSTLLLLTLVFGYFSFGTKFDSDVRNINYMTEEQREDMTYFQQLLPQQDDGQVVYVVSTDSTADLALDHSLAVQSLVQQLQTDSLITGSSSCVPFLSSHTEQQKRLQRWEEFVSKYREQLTTAVTQAARREGFAEGSFDDFFQLLQRNYEPQVVDYFQPLVSTAFTSNFAVDSLHRQYHVVTQLYAKKDGINEVIESVDSLSPHLYAFDIASMNSSIANRLSDDFNYIGWACGLIVFLFLWFSLGSIELALLSFLPMAVSWIWILGIMSLLGIQFNVVNVILATFIFGQGDDYTIFMTEGCQYEYAYRKKMLASYKHSIMISALIMLIGIGSLILARHPALRSLAEVTIVGMFSVVLMAWLFPPLIFRWLVYSKGKERQRPLTLRNVFSSDFSIPSLSISHQATSFISDCYRYRGVEISAAVNRRLRLLKKTGYLKRIADEIQPDTKNIVIKNSGWGETALLIALQHPQLQVIGVEPDSDKACVARNVAENRAPNLTIVDSMPASPSTDSLILDTQKTKL